MITSWSYSKLLDAEQCMLRVRLKYIENYPRAAAPAADRGSQIHQLAEDYVRGKIKALPAPLALFKEELTALRDEFKTGLVLLEEEWGFNKDWMPIQYEGAWLRMKADAAVIRDTEAIVIDYKTGQSYGNEIKHGDQILLYAIAVLIRFPQIEKVTSEVWYIDKDELISTTYTRMQALRYVQTFTNRAEVLVGATKFMANPNIFTCKWCDFGPNKGNQCTFGVKAGDTPIKFYREKFG